MVIISLETGISIIKKLHRFSDLKNIKNIEKKFKKYAETNKKNF